MKKYSNVISFILFLANLQMAITMLWIAFGDYTILENNTDKLWNKYMVASMLIYPILDAVYFTIKMIKRSKNDER